MQCIIFMQNIVCMQNHYLNQPTFEGLRIAYNRLESKLIVQCL